MSILADYQIEDLCLWNLQPELNMINPFVNTLVTERSGKKIISYGLSSYGYDIRLSDKEFYVFHHLPGRIVDPKNFNVHHLERVYAQEDETGKYFVLPGNSYGLGVAIECLNMPRDITAVCVGKSTYARVGVIANITPAEAGWIGHLTLEFSNSAKSDVKLYTNEGIAQLLFFSGQSCRKSYADRKGKYQGQTEKVQVSKV